jgi:protein-tyrosine phosphatase
VPRHRPTAAREIASAFERAATERVEVACGGGRGRTGTALACMATLTGLTADDAIAYVRRHYDRHAVETPFQRRYVRDFARYL